MKSFMAGIVKRTVFGETKRNDRKEYSSYVLAKGFRILRILVIRNIKDMVLITLGVFSAALGFKGFLLTNDFIDGGATGISLLISATTKIPLYWLLIGVNIPFIFMAYHTLGRNFAVKTVLAIGLLAFVVGFVDFPNVTDDNLLVALFGGFFLGAGIGLAVRGGAVIDGTEVLAIYLSRKLGLTIGDVIIVINVIIFGTAAKLLSVEIALYSMVTYLAASKTLDFVIEGIEEYMGVTIISVHNEEIEKAVRVTLGRGVTVYAGKRGFGHKGATEEMDILYTVVTRLELNKLNTEIEKIDPYAFLCTIQQLGHLKPI
ncbi:MAG: YitT family protein [Flavobacteriales bacterium]